MNNVIGKLAILFAGFIVAGVFLNIYFMLANLLLLPLLISLQLNFGIHLPSETVCGPLYWICFAAGFVTSFFIMRPAWNGTEKQIKRVHEPTAETKPENDPGDSQ